MITRLKLSTIEQGLPKYRSMLAGNDAYIPTSFESIATATGTGSSGTITFSSIPSTYQHLQIRWLARSSAAVGQTTARITFNGSSTSYARHELSGNGTSAVADGLASQTYTEFQNGIPGANQGANIMGVCIADVLDYASSSKAKTIRMFGSFDANGSGSIILASGLWTSTAAINSITLTLASGNFTTSSTFALYGIKGA